MIRIQILYPDHDFLPIPDRGVKKTTDPGSATLLLSSVADPGSRMGKISRSGYGKNIPGHISESFRSHLQV
jgi:hypothetical protein